MDNAMTTTGAVPAGADVPHCDICGSFRALLLAKANPHRLRTYFCMDCALVYGWPRPPASDLDNYYDDEFTGDGGALAAPGGTLDSNYLNKEERTVQQWSGPFAAAALNLRNARVVDLRGRTGALARFMADAGAQVLHTDPFPANVAYARERRGLSAQVLKLTDTGAMADWPSVMLGRWC